MLQQDDFLQFDVLVILHGFGTDDQGILILQNHIAAGHHVFSAPANHSHNHTIGQTKIFYRHADPLVVRLQMGLNKVHILFRTVLAHTLQTGILVHEAGRNNTGRNGNHTHTEKGYDDTEYLSQRSNGVYVTITDGQQCGHRPPDTREGVGKYLRLSLMLQTVHTKAGRHHQHQNDEHGRKQLLFLAGNNRRDHVDGVVIGIDLKQAENAHHTEHTEDRRTCREYDGQIMGQEGQQINDARKRQQVFFRGLPVGQILI